MLTGTSVALSCSPLDPSISGFPALLRLIHQIPSRAANNAVPLERWAGVGLVRLDMVMSQDALIRIQVTIWQLFGNQVALGILGIIALDFRKNAAKCRRQFRQCLV